MIVTIFKNIKSVSAGFNRNVFTVLERIKNGRSKELVELIRNEKDKVIRDEFKKNLPSVCFSGTFTMRADSALQKHSGLICLDFDKFSSNTELEFWKEKLLKDRYTFAIWISPSGSGLKVLVKVPAEKQYHRDYFKALEIYYTGLGLGNYFDTTCINESRVCYESYDPNIHIMSDSTVWIERDINQEYVNLGTNKPVFKLKTDNEIIQKLMVWFKRNYSMSKGQRNNSLFILASAFNEFGVPQISAETILKEYISSDFKEKEIENTIKSAYSNTIKFRTKFFEDDNFKERVTRKIREGKSEKELKESFDGYTKDEVEKAITTVKSNLTITEFWYYNEYGEIKLIPHKFKQFLEQNGFYKYYPPGNDNYIFIRVEENLISDTNPAHIKDFVLDYLYNGDFGIKPYDFIASATKYFKEDYLSFLATSDVKFKDDTQDSCYLYFKNCAVQITNSGIKEIDYIELQGFVWKKHIIDREFKKITTLEADQCDFKKFVELISGQEQKRFESMISVIGYLLHSYKTSANNKAIILNDEVISEIPNGGSGKGIFCNAIGHIKRFTFLDGKQFDFNKAFPYQTVSADTQMLVFDDVKKNFVFESLFSLVTEGITLEKKNRDAIKLPVSKSPKIVITTNYTVKGVGGSFERRKFEIELSSYFGIDRTPFDEFGKMLFDDWSESEWCKFDNFMIYCVQYYLKTGLVAHKFHNLEARKFINQTTYEFYEWSLEAGEVENIPVNERIKRAELYEKYIEEYPDQKKFLTEKRFSNWINYYAQFIGCKLNRFKTQGVRYIELIKEPE
jgi:hypothetical protein